MNLPSISVIMPVYNSEKYVAQAIKSVLDQTYGDFELMIMDDGSTDQSLRVIESFTDPRIRLFKNEKNRGIADAVNTLLGESVGQFIARVDSDDILFPDRFQKQIDYFKEHPEVGVLSGSLQHISENGEMIPCSPWTIPDPYVIKFWLTFENVMNQPASMFRKSALDQVKYYSDDFAVAEDYDIFTRLSKITLLANLKDKLVYYRIHDSNISFTKAELVKKNHSLISKREIKLLTGEDVDEELLLLLVDPQKKLTPAQTKSLANLYRRCLQVYFEKEKLSPAQLKKLKYTMSWRIHRLTKCTKTPVLVTNEILWVYFHNKDVFVKDIKKLFHISK